ncbi:hypothetical protein CC77DRAFT_463938 [Alternaria alternata]|uniref:DUF7703 domain-containing protein n=1 Tax=Alternaria alternata TaxID=5599 RepID=A0A177D6H9_ALTAL|nr:hypothetical protein CC77DRAFT_463938 [Alternaria alternata]OAG15343.1 hypothetical protein CC77DRAFT_463938 [Alternaria alternata]
MSAPTSFFRVNGVDITHLFIAFGAVAIWSTLTLTIRLLTTMKKRSGIYFYSILIATWGLTIRQVGNYIQFYAPRCPWQVGFTMQQLGWVGMISGFSMVLYSRLTIILESHRARRVVLGMIIFNGCVWHTVMITVLSGMRTTQYAGRPADTRAWKHVHDRVEKVQVVTFAVQDIILSCLYLRAAYQYLQGRFTQSSKTRSVMCLLLLVQFVAIAFDVAIVFMDFAGYLQLKFIVFSFAYAVKLELEFVALNQLVELSKMGLPGIASMSLRAFKTDENEVMVNKMPSTAIRTFSVAKMGPGETSSDTPPCAPQSSSDTLDFITTPGQLDA